MNKLLQSRFVANYGMFFVLLLLCGYFSLMTVAEQNPVSARAGRGVATYIADNHPDAWPHNWRPLVLQVQDELAIRHGIEITPRELDAGKLRDRLG